MEPEPRRDSRAAGAGTRSLPLQALLPHLSSVHQPEQTLGPFSWTAAIAENSVRFVITCYSPPRRSSRPVLPRLSYSRGRGLAHSDDFGGAEIRNWGYEKGCPTIRFLQTQIAAKAEKHTGFWFFLFGYKTCKGRRAELLSQPSLSCLTEE